MRIILFALMFLPLLEVEAGADGCRPTRQRVVRRVVVAEPVLQTQSPQSVVEHQNVFYSTSPQLAYGAFMQMQQQNSLQAQIQREWQRNYESLQRLQDSAQQMWQQQWGGNYSTQPYKQPYSYQPPARQQQPRYEPTYPAQSPVANQSCVATAANTCPGGVAAPQMGQDSYPQPRPSVVRNQCLRCHGATEQKGDLRFDRPVTASQLQRARERLRDGEMPPDRELTLAQRLCAAIELLPPHEQQQLLQLLAP